MLRYMVCGEKGAAETDVSREPSRDGSSARTITGRRVNGWQRETWSPEQDFAYFHNTHDQALDIVRRVVEGEPPRISPQDALETTRLCFAAEALSKGKQTVRLDEFKTAGAFAPTGPQKEGQ